MLLGAHFSISKGIVNAVKECEHYKCDVFQLFTKNQRQWKKRHISSSSIHEFVSLVNKLKVKFVISHASYLVNLASPSNDIYKKSIEDMFDEIEVCGKLKITYCVVHCGSTKGKDFKWGIRRMAQALKIIAPQAAKNGITILLENTEGSGYKLGKNLEQIAEIIDITGHSNIGLCLDTCHLFAAGYDISSPEALEKVIVDFDKKITINTLKVWHLNDSKTKCASFLDRHQHIGKGYIGEGTFAYIMKNFPNVPKIIETPKENNMDAINLEKLRQLYKENTR